MGYGIKVKRLGNTTRFSFLSLWEGELAVNTTDAELEGLGKKLKAFALGKCKKLKYTIAYDGGQINVAVRKDYKGRMPLISFEYEDTHPLFQKISENVFYYDGFTLEELAAFGTALSGFGKTGEANLI